MAAMSTQTTNREVDSNDDSDESTVPEYMFEDFLLSLWSDDEACQHVVSKKRKVTTRTNSNEDSNDESSDNSNNDINNDLHESAIREDKREELQLIKEKAKNGDVHAMVEIANIYHGYKVYDEALRYFEMAASHGNLEALVRLADCYLNGWGVSQNVNKGLQYYEEAADRGSCDAMERLAKTYLYGGSGVTRDLDKARQYYEKWADAGDKLHKLALSYQGGDSLCHNMILGANVDEAKSFNLLKKNAEQNDEESMYELGRCYPDGKGTSPDPVKAKEWFLKATADDNWFPLFGLSLFGLAIMVVGEGLTTTEKQTIDDLIHCRGLDYKVLEWFQWYSNKKGVETACQQVDDLRSTLDDFGLADATYLLASLLALTLDHDNLRIANKLICNVKHELDRHKLLAWVSILVEDLCRENEELSHVELSDIDGFDMQEELRPVALVGHGQFGKVYLAWYSPEQEWDWDPSCYVAIKFVDINLASEDKVLARNVVREQFACRVLKWNGVKNTVKYLGCTELLERRKRGLIFELCADLMEVEQLAEEARKNIDWGAPIDLKGLPNWIGKVPSSLRSCVVFCTGSKWTTVKVITMLREAAEALLEVHKIGFIHRDIAPRNILCDGKGNIQLADFGWAKFVGSSHDDASNLAYYGKACFTDKHQYALAWWAPECFGTEEEDEDAIFSWNSDVYAFGVPMWQCFAHKDPFSSVQDPERIKKMILEGKTPSLKKMPNKGGALDGSTPDDLIALIDSCWKDSATERLKLADVIKVLKIIKPDLQNGTLPRQGRRAFKGDASQYWFDESIYKVLKDGEHNLTAPSMKEIYGGDYTEAQNTKRLQKICHERKIIDEILAHVKNSLEEYPYDVFLVHAGEQKMGPVDSMQRNFKDGGLRCFLDRDMMPGSNPTGSMRSTLTTCRYAIVVLSHEFFTKQHPTSELMYSLRFRNLARS